MSNREKKKKDKGKNESRGGGVQSAVFHSSAYMLFGKPHTCQKSCRKGGADQEDGQGGGGGDDGEEEEEEEEGGAGAWMGGEGDSGVN